jgi:hypothetical protein
MGYRLPTETEWNDERLSWAQAPISSANNAAGAFASPLKLPAADYRDGSNGSLSLVGDFGYYWSSTLSGTGAMYLRFSSSAASVRTLPRANGFAVRCIKD